MIMSSQPEQEAGTSIPGHSGIESFQFPPLKTGSTSKG